MLIDSPAAQPFSLPRLPGGPSPMTFNGGHPIGDFPLVIQQLMPIMIYNQISAWHTTGGTGGGIPVLRYPGAVFTDPNPDSSLSPPASGYLVRIPKVTATQYPGTPVIDTVTFDPDPTHDTNKAVQEIQPSQGLVPFGIPTTAHNVADGPCLAAAGRGGVADQLSLSIGEHERLSAQAGP